MIVKIESKAHQAVNGAEEGQNHHQRQERAVGRTDQAGRTGEFPQNQRDDPQKQQGNDVCGDKGTVAHFFVDEHKTPPFQRASRW